MRLGLTIDALSPQLTGIGRYVWQLCEGLKDCEEIDDLAFHRFNAWERRPEVFLNSRQPRRKKRPKWWKRLTERTGFRHRLIHGANYFLPERSEFGVITVHDLSIYRHPDTNPAERIAAFERGFESSIARAHHIITDSESVKSELVAVLGLSPDKISTVHLGVSDTFGPRNAVERAEVVKRIVGTRANSFILSVATFEPRKRIEQAILAHAELAERMPSVPPLVLVGASGWRNEALHDLIEERVSHGSLVMLGHVPDAELPAIYAAAGLFVYPSIYEGFGLPPIEAMASGVPVIVSNLSCLPEVTKGAALMIDPDDVTQFASAMERGLQDDNWRVPLYSKE